jgi:NADH-quinone oxidoreductase subunit G
VAPAVSLPTAVWHALLMKPGDRVVVTQGTGSATLVAAHDATLAPSAVRISAARVQTQALGAMFGPVSVKKA